MSRKRKNNNNGDKVSSNRRLGRRNVGIRLEAAIELARTILDGTRMDSNQKLCEIIARRIMLAVTRDENMQAVERAARAAAKEQGA
jgi:hypothetical protein